MFEVGDFVKTENGEIGVVGWTENKCMNLTKKDGYIGISLKTGSQGFLAPVKADKCTASSLDKLLKRLQVEKKEVEESLYKTVNNEKAFEKMCEENKLLKKLLTLYMAREE